MLRSGWVRTLWEWGMVWARAVVRCVCVWGGGEGGGVLRRVCDPAPMLRGAWLAPCLGP